MRIKLESAHAEFAVSKLLECLHWIVFDSNPSSDRQLETASHAQNSLRRRWIGRRR
jgi:hypothetical protein